VLVVVKNINVARARFPPRWNDVQDVFVLVHEENLTHVSFYLRWNDVVRDALVLV
jgi:hypothetical protein